MGVGVVGREAELAAIGRFLDEVDGGPAVLVLSGAAGIGKTTLWSAGVEEARERGFGVWACQPTAAEVRSSYAGLLDLLAGTAVDGFERLPDVQARALDAALLRGRADSTPDARAVAVGMLSMIEERARDAPLLLAVDDLQWLDAPTLDVLRFAVRRCSCRVAVLVSWRDDPASRPPAELRPHDPARVERVEIGPMTVGVLHQVLKARVARMPNRPEMVRIAAVSGGNPFYAIELARSDRPALPGRLRELINDKLGPLDAAVREALLTVSALGAPCTDLLERALDADAGEVLAPAEDAGIVEIAGGAVRFAHPLLAEGVYARASAPRRRKLHRQLAAVVEDAEERARHLARAATGPDTATVEALDHASDQARDRGAPAAAAELLELALGLGEDDPARRIRAAALRLDTGDPGTAEKLVAPAIAALDPGPLRAQALRLLGMIRYSADDCAAAIDVLEQAKADAGDDLLLGVEIAAELSLALGNGGRVADALDVLERAVADAERLGDAGLLAEFLSGRTVYRFLDGQPLDEVSLGRAVKLEDPTRHSHAANWPSSHAAILDACAGRLDEALSGFVALIRRCVERGEESDVWFLTYHAVGAACAKGDIQTAETLVADALRRAVFTDGGFARGMTRLSEAHLHAWVGRIAEARAAVGEARELLASMGAAAAELGALSTAGALELSVGDSEAAARILAPAAAAMAAMGLREPRFFPFLPDAVEALLAVSRRDEAEPLVDLLEASGAIPDRHWARAVGARCRGLLSAAGGDLDDAERQLEAAIRAHDRLPLRYDRARTLLASGRLRRRRKDRRAARALFEEAIGLFEEVGAAQWVALTRQELERVSPRHRPSLELTPTEQRVAALAAGGHTNAEVAAALFISVKTVEANLGRVYRKLGIRSRAELGSWGALQKEG